MLLVPRLLPVCRYHEAGHFSSLTTSALRSQEQMLTLVSTGPSSSSPAYPFLRDGAGEQNRPTTEMKMTVDV